MEPLHHPIERVDELLAKDIPLVDVREPEEWEGGMIDGAAKAPLSGLRSGELGDVAELDPHEPVALYCRGGVRSEEAARILIEKGFSTVYTLDGGYMALQDR